VSDPAEIECRHDGVHGDARIYLQIIPELERQGWAPSNRQRIPINRHRKYPLKRAATSASARGLALKWTALRNLAFRIQQALNDAVTAFVVDKNVDNFANALVQAAKDSQSTK
jgi:hypothetical protein